MTEKTNEQGQLEGTETVENKIGQGDILGDVTHLGKKLGQAFQSAWESDKRRQIQDKLLEELKTASEQVDHLAQRAKATAPGREISEGASKLGRQLGDGLLSGLKALNRELTRTLEKFDNDQNSSDNDEPETEKD